MQAQASDRSPILLAISRNRCPGDNLRQWDPEEVSVAKASREFDDPWAATVNGGRGRLIGVADPV